jgi:siroheme synthase (precorrin-2 oxidase/ferrochelatase)
MQSCSIANGRESAQKNGTHLAMACASQKSVCAAVLFLASHTPVLSVRDQFSSTFVFCAAIDDGGGCFVQRNGG